jgi:nucleoredoxin
MRNFVLFGLALSALARASAAFAAEPPETLALQDLVGRPDLWPPYVAMPHDFRFPNGAVVHQGDKAQIAKFDGSKLYLVDGAIRFMALATDCGFLDAANQAWSALTPAQRDVGPASLASDQSLWPARVKTVVPISCTYGNLPLGTNVDLIQVTAQGTLIGWPNSTNRLSVSFDCTDVFAGARQLAAIAPDSRPSRIAAALEGSMVDATGQPYRDGHLEGKKIYALYFGASWCAPCHAFSPDLVKFLSQTLPSHPELAAVLISEDQQPDQMLAYMKEENMPFPAVPRSRFMQSVLLRSYAAEIIPQFTIVDRFGKVLASNDDLHGNRGDPEDTIGALRRLLASSTAGP